MLKNSAQNNILGAITGRATGRVVRAGVCGAYLPSCDPAPRAGFINVSQADNGQGIRLANIHGDKRLAVITKSIWPTDQINPARRAAGHGPARRAPAVRGIQKPGKPGLTPDMIGLEPGRLAPVSRPRS